MYSMLLFVHSITSRQACLELSAISNAPSCAPGKSLMLLDKLMTDKNVTLYRELVPIPHQFNTTYSSAISIINDDLRKLDIEKTVDLFWVYLSELDDLLKGGKVSEAVTSTKKTKHEIDKVSRDDLNSSFGKMFSTDQTKEYLPFKEVIGTYKDIERINWHILAYEALFRVVSTICQKIDRIEKKVTLIITTLESNKNPDLALVKAFHDLVYAFAVQCDALGVVLHHIQRIEHNWVLALDKLTKLNLEKK
ncbi:unnamed protein product [Sphagnum balticum]